MKLSKSERQSILDKFGGRCAYCGCELGVLWCVDHIKPVVRESKWNKDKGRFVATGKLFNPENDTIENLNPACKSCNTLKNSYTLERFRECIAGYVVSLNRDSVQYRMAKKYGLVQETKLSVVFFFEKVAQDKEELERLEKTYEI